MSDTTLANDAATETQDVKTENQVATKNYTQEEVDNMMARMRGSIERKLLKPYEDLGDPQELRGLRDADEKRRTDCLLYTSPSPRDS